MFFCFSIPVNLLKSNLLCFNIPLFLCFCFSISVILLKSNVLCFSIPLILCFVFQYSCNLMFLYPCSPKVEGGILFYLCPSKIFFVAFFSVTVDGRNLIIGHKRHIGIPYYG
jgi:hypothetical protein